MSQPNKKILLVIGTLEIGGAEKHITELSLRLRKYNLEFSVCALVGGGPLKEKLEKGGIQIFSSSFHLPAFVNKIPKLRGLSSLLISILVFYKAIFKFRPNGG